MIDKISHLEREQLHGCFFGKIGDLLSEDLLSRGSFDHVYVPIREIIMHAIQIKAKNLVLFHNHPSGRPWPSRNDVVITQQLEEAAELVDLLLVDHFVVADGLCVSMRNEGALTKKLSSYCFRDAGARLPGNLLRSWIADDIDRR